VYSQALKQVSRIDAVKFDQVMDEADIVPYNPIHVNQVMGKAGLFITDLLDCCVFFLLLHHPSRFSVRYVAKMDIYL